VHLSGDDMLRGLAEATTTVTEEVTDVPLAVTGALPAAIDGVYFRNGPGRFERGGQRYRHPFDGDGHVTRLDFADGQVRYTNRFVRTEEYLAEERAGRMLYRGFGTNLPGGLWANLFRLNFKNAANTSVRWHAGRLLALWEGGAPYRLDPATLATLGQEDFDDALRSPRIRRSRRPAPRLPFTAHPCFDAQSGELLSFGLVSGAPNRLMLYRIGADGVMDPPRQHGLARFSFVHDFAVTGRWLCFLLPHADFDLRKALLGLSTAVGSLRIATERPMQVLLLPRQPGDRPVLLEGPPGFVFHIAQAFDDEHGRLVLDVIRYGAYPQFDALDALFRNPPAGTMPRLARLAVDPARQRCEPLSLGPELDQLAFELPVTRPGACGEPRRILYGIGAPPDRRAPYLTSIHRVDTDTGALVTRDFGADLVGEPMLVPGTDGSEGWLLSLVHRAGEGRTDLVVLRAEDLAIQASAALPHRVPVGFHGCWVGREALWAGGG
jgi:all-trans-8'-apo-beta-carotenal 15,15'-oxygenase